MVDIFLLKLKDVKLCLCNFQVLQHHYFHWNSKYATASMAGQNHFSSPWNILNCKISSVILQVTLLNWAFICTFYTNYLRSIPSKKFHIYTQIRKRQFVRDKYTQWNASKFAIFIEIEKTHICKYYLIRIQFQ